MRGFIPQGGTVFGGGLVLKMRSLKRNKRELWYALYDGEMPIYVTDKDGNIVYMDIGDEQVPTETGEFRSVYSIPEKFKANISPGRGYAQNEVFGINADFTRSISTTNMSNPIDEYSLIWDREPKVLVDGTADATDAVYRVAGRPARGLTSIVIPIKAIARNSANE